MKPSQQQKNMRRIEARSALCENLEIGRIAARTCEVDLIFCPTAEMGQRAAGVHAYSVPNAGSKPRADAMAPPVYTAKQAGHFLQSMMAALEGLPSGRTVREAA